MQRSREQVIKTLSHQEPGRVVVDFGSTTSTGISASAYNRLKTSLDVTTGHTRVFDPVQQLALVEDELLDRFSADLVAIGKDYDNHPDHWYYILAIGILGMLNTTVQPNMLVANGSARDEYTARFGFTVGCFLKRFCTVFWGLFALVAIGK